jgi:hypothetical protein
MSKKELFEAYWQVDIAWRAMRVAESSFIQSQTDDPELDDHIQIVVSNLEVIINSLKEYVLNEIENPNQSMDS